MSADYIKLIFPNHANIGTFFWATVWLLLELYPNIQFCPNYHTALHLVSSSCNLGPCIAGGCFHLEGSLVSYRKLTWITRWVSAMYDMILNTTYKLNIGKLEAIMLKTFCAGTNSKALLKGNRCPSALRMAVPILERKWDQGQWTGTIGELNNLGNSGEIWKVDNGKEVSLHRKIYDNAFHIAFEKVSRTLPHVQDNSFRSTKKHDWMTIGGKLFHQHPPQPHDHGFVLQEWLEWVHW